MYLQLIKNDLKNSKLSSISIAIFISISVLLLSTAAGLSTGLVSSMEKLFEQAQTPHMMQMHKGDVDLDRLENFVSSHPVIEEYQVAEFLNVHGEDIVINERDLSYSVQDNGLAVQNKYFDFLLDLNNEVIQVNKGEIYVPIYYLKELHLKVNDICKIANKNFRVAGFVRDSQMNAGLVSSKRFVINEEDMKNMRTFGTMEHLIEFRLSDISQIPDIEADYTKQNLESNGPPMITLRLFKLINMITDGIMIALLVTISLFIMLMSLLCLRFTIIAKLHEEYRDIGTLRGIGIRMGDIKKLYLSKYIAIAGFSSFLGFVLSLRFKNFFIAGIELYLGKTESGSFSFFLSFGISFMVFLILSLYIRNGVSTFKNISPADAIRYGSPKEASSHSKNHDLLRYRLSPNVFLSLKELLYETRIYSSMLSVLVIAVFLIVVPFNMYNTLDSEDFIKYMGLGKYDVRLDLSQIDNIEIVANKIYEEISKDKDVSEVNYVLSKAFDLVLPDGSTQKLKVELGDHTRSPIEYTSGFSPLKNDEIALSFINAEELNKKVGEELILKINGKNKTFVVCGIYNDLTNGGKTAKANFKSKEGSYLWAIITVTLRDKQTLPHKIQEYKTLYPYCKLSDVEEYLDQTFGSTRDAVKQVSYTSLFLSLSLCFVLSLLFMRMMYMKDRPRLALLRGIGIQVKQIKIQSLIKAAMMTAFSTILGLILSNTLGSILTSFLLSTFGMSNVVFLPNVWIHFVVVPLGVFLSVAAASLSALNGIDKLDISKFMKE